MVDVVATNALQTAVALTDADEVVLNQSGITKRGPLTLFADYIASKLWGAYTTYVPTVTASTPAGSGFTHSLVNARYKKVGRRVEAIVDIQITNIGSGPAATGTVNVSLPVAAAYRSTFGHGKEYGSTNKGLTVSVSAGASLAIISLADASGVAMATGRSYSFGIIYEAAS
ncbi:hypothetical protein [Brevundimonas sp. Root1279]|uniref:hypothetical protein n=1 Tax=Brevundimonas sp. Root1279 TaxID=1736443 RepID=UPI0006F37451|nr:hypothetical protein [Brevundimonas sp. Root1279]KQW79705.1 hypothetical protein ASC65_14245 [Brevundimonas sp. Root1279]